MNPPRIGLVGARRVRQGLGPFVAAHLARLGAAPTCFLGTGPESVRAAGIELAQAHGVRATGYVDLEEMLSNERLDALAILSPPETHERYLSAALEAGLSVLCEKPLIWEGEGLAERASRFEDGFHARGLLLSENCQWPRVLPAFARLHPDVLEGPVRSFSMRLSPASRGAQMVGDALPHPLSVLQALHPGSEARLEGVEASTRDPEAAELRLGFRFVTPAAEVETEVELVHGEALPREAALSINGRAGRRLVRVEDYSQFLGSGARVVDVADPLASNLYAFLEDLEATRTGGPPAPTREISQRMQMLETLLHSFEGRHR